MNLIQQIEAEEIAKATTGASKEIPTFRPGDTLRVGVKVVEGEREPASRTTKACASPVQQRGMGSNFTVRKMSFGEGVERVFPLYSPNIDSSPWCAAASCAAPSFITCAAAPASARVLPSARSRGPKRLAAE